LFSRGGNGGNLVGGGGTYLLVGTMAGEKGRKVGGRGKRRKRDVNRGEEERK